MPTLYMKDFVSCWKVSVAWIAVMVTLIVIIQLWQS